MSDTYRPGGTVPVAEVMVLDTHYRVTFQPITKWNTKAGFSMHHDLGITTLAYAKTELAAHKFRNDEAMAIWLEHASIGSEVWRVVLDE